MDECNEYQNLVGRSFADYSAGHRRMYEVGLTVLDARCYLPSEVWLNGPGAWAIAERFKQDGLEKYAAEYADCDDYAIKAWDAVRDAHQIEGQVVPVTGTFTLADGVTARYPGDPGLPPEDRINCRCFLTPVIE
jgi:hypothetical protein